MTETLAIIISIIGACTAFGAGACKYYTDRNNQQENEIIAIQHVIDRVENNEHDTHVLDDIVGVTPPILQRDPIRRPATPAHNLEDLIIAQLQDRNSDRDSDIEINIHVHTQNHEHIHMERK